VNLNGSWFGERNVWLRPTQKFHSSRAGKNPGLKKVLGLLDFLGLVRF